MYRILIIVFFVALFFGYATTAYGGLHITAVSVEELQGEASPMVDFWSYYFTSRTHFHFKGYFLTMESDNLRISSYWGEDQEGIDRIFGFRVKFPARTGVKLISQWFVGFNKFAWENPSDTMPEPQDHHLYDLNFGQEYIWPVVNGKVIKLGFACEWAVPVFCLLDFNDYSFDGSPAYPGGEYSMWGVAGSIGLNMLIRLTPRTSLFAQAEYGLNYYWYGSVFDVLIWTIDVMNDDIIIEYDLDPNEPYAIMAVGKFNIGLRYSF